MKKYIKTSTIDETTITIDIVVVVEEALVSVAAGKNIKRNVHKSVPKRFSMMEYQDFIGRVIAILESEYGFRLAKSDTSTAKSLSYYYTFIKQDEADRTVKLVLGCRVSDHDDDETPEGIKRRVGFERNKAISFKSISDSKLKYDFISVNVNDKRFHNYREAAENVRDLLDNHVVFIEVK